jgi:hypothetical protein
VIDYGNLPFPMRLGRRVRRGWLPLLLRLLRRNRSIYTPAPPHPLPEGVGYSNSYSTRYYWSWRWWPWTQHRGAAHPGIWRHPHRYEPKGRG